MARSSDTPAIAIASPAGCGEASERASDSDAARNRIRAAVSDFLRSKRGAGRARTDWRGGDGPEVYERTGDRVRRRGAR
jgi:hypothetical protein